jgi:hypothetical protein
VNRTPNKNATVFSANKMKTLKPHDVVRWTIHVDNHNSASWEPYILSLGGQQYIGPCKCLVTILVQTSAEFQCFCCCSDKSANSRVCACMLGLRVHRSECASVDILIQDEIECFLGRIYMWDTVRARFISWRSPLQLYSPVTCPGYVLTRSNV